MATVNIRPPNDVRGVATLFLKEIIMRLLKAAAGVCILVVLGSALGGCVVVPYPHGHGDYYHYRH